MHKDRRSPPQKSLTPAASASVIATTVFVFASIFVYACWVYTYLNLRPPGWDRLGQFIRCASLAFILLVVSIICTLTAFPAARRAQSTKNRTPSPHELKVLRVSLGIHKIFFYLFLISTVAIVYAIYGR